MSRRLSSVVLALAGLLILPVFLRGAPPAAADDMAEAASAFLASLSPDQRTQASFAFEDAERFDFHFIPKARKGVPIGELSEAQRERAMALLQSGLGMRGFATAKTIMSLENVLADLEGPGRRIPRDPGLYYVSIFGTPAGGGPWGWRFEGHHISTNFTIASGHPAAWAPLFFGSNPAIVRDGPMKGTEALPGEQQKARDLVQALDADRKAKATIQATAPRDIVTMAEREVSPLATAGLAARDMTSSQRRILEELIDVYLSRVAPDLAKARLARLQAAGMDDITFGIAGTFEPGRPHYYRVQGPTFLIEYDNTQNDANHIHSMWRDFHGDFGRDLLAEHYAAYAHE